MSQDIWAELEQEDAARRSRGAALTAPPVPPDTMSEALRIAERRGVPAGAVVQDMPRYKQLDELDAVQGAAAAHPALGSWLIEPTNVALSKDELPQVSKLANSIAQTKTTQDRPYDWGPWGWGQFAADLGGSVVGGFNTAFGSALGGLADLNEAFGRTAERGLRAVGGGAAADAIRGAPVDVVTPALRGSGGFINENAGYVPQQSGTATDVAAGLGTLGGQVLTAYAGGLPAVTTLNLGLGANQAADMARKAGAEGTAGADAAVLASAPVAAVLERVGLDRLLNRAPPGIKNVFGRWVADKLIAAGIEGTQEATEQVVYNALAQNLYNPDQALTEGLAQNFEVGGWVGGIARTLTGARYARTQAEREGELLDAITQDAGAVLLRERNPAKFRELAEKLAASGADRVYVDGVEAAAYFQSAGLDPSQFMDADALTDAAVAGTDVAIPLEDWITRVAPDHGAALSKFARLTPSGMSRADLEQFNERAEAEFQAFLDAVPQDTMGPDTSQQVYDDVLGQLLGTGMNRQAAEANAELHRRFWQTQAQRSGKSAMELYQPYGLRIQREDPAGMAILRERPSADAAVDSLLGRLVTGDIPTEAQAMGPSLVEWLAGQGGVNDPAMAGELRRLNESDRVNRRGKPKLVTKLGRSLDQARELAVEAGYLPEGADLNALLDAITQEVDGGPAIRVGGDQVLADQRNMLIQAGDLLNEAGVDPADREAARRFLLGGGEFDQVPVDVARGLNMETKLPDDPLFAEAVANTPGAEIDPDGLIIDLVRFQKAEQTGDTSVRTGVFYLPVGSKNTRHYKSTPSTDSNAPYGGNVKVQGKTLLRRPLFVKGATGGKAPEAAFIELRGKDAFKDLDQDLSGVMSSMSAFRQRGELDEIVYDMLQRHGGDPDMAWDIVRNSTKGNQLRYAMQENIVAHAVRDAGYDSVVGYSKGKNGASISEVFDVREVTYPTPEGGYELHSVFYQDALPEQDEVAALKARIASLEKELRTDELTGLRNRRAFNEDEALGWEGVMAFDMDGLTALNAMGHEVGDAALKAIGEVMLASETDTARFYHTSGDEFYGRATTMAEAQELAQMIQDKLESVDLDIVMAGSDGQTRDFTYRGIGVSRGAGATPNEADQVAIRNKAEREASGVRQAKGDTGPLRRLIDRRAEGNRDRRQRVDPQQEGNAEATEDGLTELDQSKNRPQVQGPTSPPKEVAAGDYSIRFAPWGSGVGYGSPVDRMVTIRSADGRKKLGEAQIEYNDNDGYAINSIKVDQSARRQGVGTALLDAIFKEIPADRLKITTGLSGDGRALMERYGLQEGDGQYVLRPDRVPSPQLLNQDESTDSIRRGWINFANRASVQIGLTPKADLSTFIHESGHFFLEVMGDLARDPNAPQDIVDDYAAIVRFLGVSSREEIGREQHEKLARAFESYLGEGKAPVPELAGVMARMRAWMLQVYKTLRALDVELNDEIRGVFDRMLVGDAAVSRAESAANMEPLFREAAAAGMTEARFREYLKQQQAGHEEAMARISARAVREVQREQDAWWKAARADMLEEVRAETYALPVYQAWANLARGTQPDGSPLPEGMASMKLDKDWLVARYGQQYLNDNLRFKRVYAAQGTNGDVVAGQFGFPNGDALVTALVNAPPMQAYIQATTDARMAEKYGDMRTDPAMAEKAMQIAHNDRRMAAIAGDVAVLEGLAGAPALDRATVKSWARQKIAGTQLRDVVPFVYLRSERKHAREAQRLAAAGKYAEALVEARQRLANAMLYDEATKAKDLADRVDKRLTKLAKKSAQTRLAKAGGDWLQLTNSILAALGRYDFGPNRGPLNMAQWIDKHVEAENENPIPASVELLVDSQQTTEMKRLTIQQIRDVRTAVMNIDTQAAAVAKVMANDKAVEWEAARDALTGRLEETQAAGPSAFTEAEKSTADRIMDGIKGFADVLLSPQTIIERLDGGEQGPWHDLFWNIAARARDARDVMRESTLKPLFDMMEGWDKAKRQRIMMDTVRMESLGGVELKRQTLISMALNMGTDSSLKKLMGGGRWVNGQHVEFTQPVIDEVVAKLTREDWEIVQAVWNASASLKKPTEELQKRLGGIIPRDLATRTIETPFGTIQGQYFPLIGDPTQSSVGEKQQATATVQQIIGPTARATTSKSRLQERTGVMYPLELNLETLLLGRVDEVITDITHREFLLQANKILDDGRLRNLLRTRAGDTAYQSLRGAVARAVGDRIYGDPAMRYPNKLMDAATTNLSVMALGFRYLLGVGNYAAAWPQAVSRVGVKHLVSAFSRTLGPGQFQAAQTFVYRLSPYMANRNGDFDRQFQKALRSMAGKQSLRRDVARFAMAYQQTADRLAVVPIWMARFEQAIAAGESQAAAVRLADTAIQQTQTDHSAIGLSAFEGDKSFRLFKLFIGPMIIQQNRIRDALARKGYSRSQSVPERMGVLLAAWVVPALLFDLILLRFPEDDDEDGLDAGDWSKWAFTKTVMYPLQTIPFVRDAAAPIEAALLGKPTFARNNPVSDAGATIAKAGVDTTEQVLDRVREGEEIDGERMFRNWFKALGVGLGLPTAAVTPPGEFIYDVAMNEYTPEGPQDLRYLFVRREDR
jgi:GGDEF domain-containing protein/GNAT superfamily N-acetyltransferase